MKRMLMATAATAAFLSCSVVAHAQTVFDGFYAGAGVGAANEREGAYSIVSVPATSSSLASSITTLPRATYSRNTVSTKAFAGYNMVFDRWLAGGEVSYQPQISDNRINYGGNTFALGSSSGIISVTGRIGYLAQPDLLLYGFAGYAGRQQNFEAIFGSSTYKSGVWANGLTGGLGLEYALTNNLFLRGEVEYSQFNATNFTAPGQGFSVGSRRDSSRYGGTVSVGYRF